MAVDSSVRRAARRGDTAAAGKVLVVDDEADSADQLVEFLCRRGHAGRAVYSVVAALDALARMATIRIVLTDLKMPGLTGFALIGRAREQRAASDHTCPEFVIMTGHAGQVEAEIADAYQVLGFLTKPLDPYAVEKLVSQVIASGNAFQNPVAESV